MRRATQTIVAFIAFIFHCFHSLHNQPVCPIVIAKEEETSLRPPTKLLRQIIMMANEEDYLEQINDLCVRLDVDWKGLLFINKFFKRTGAGLSLTLSCLKLMNELRKSSILIDQYNRLIEFGKAASEALSEIGYFVEHLDVLHIYKTVCAWDRSLTISYIIETYEEYDRIGPKEYLWYKLMFKQHDGSFPPQQLRDASEMVLYRRNDDMWRNSNCCFYCSLPKSWKSCNCDENCLTPYRKFLIDNDMLDID